MKNYSVGKGRVICYCDTADQAFRAHADEGLDRRVGVYEWDAEIVPGTNGAVRIWNPKRLPWPASVKPRAR